MFDIFNIFYRITYPINYMLQFFARFVPGGRKVAGVSLAAKVALSLWIPLIIFAAVNAYFAIARDKIWAPFIDFGIPLGLTLVISLCLIFPIIIYWMVRLISVDKIEIFPDIDRPWNEGIEQLGAIGVDPKRVPLILVVGPDSYERSAGIHADSYLKLELEGVPRGESYFLHWYAGAEAIFLHLNEVCRTGLAIRNQRARSSKTSASSFETSATIGGSDSLDADFYGGDTMGGTQTGSLDADYNDGSIDADRYGGTLTGDEDYAYDKSDDSHDSHDSDSRQAPAASPDAPLNEGQMYERMEYLCGLLKKLRGDEVPVDGVLLTIPFSCIENKSGAIDNYAHEDVRQLRDNLGANFPVTVMFSEMHDVEGFVNLAHGVGSKKAQASRFGLGFVIENIPEKEDIQVLSKAVCESFQKQIYETYRRQSLENIPTNKKLFNLLSRLSLGVQDRISKFLQNIMISPEGIRARDYISLSGCYFAATGRKEIDESAFVNGVLKKTIENCECTNWSYESRRKNNMFRGLAGLFSLLAVGCFGATAYFLVKGMIDG